MKCTAGSAHLVRDVDGRRSALEHRGNLGVLDRYPSLVQGSPTALARRGLLDLDKHAVTVLARLPTAQPLELVLGAHAGVGAVSVLVTEVHGNGRCGVCAGAPLRLVRVVGDLGA